MEIQEFVHYRILVMFLRSIYEVQCIFYLCYYLFFLIIHVELYDGLSYVHLNFMDLICIYYKYISL